MNLIGQEGEARMNQLSESSLAETGLVVTITITYHNSFFVKKIKTESSSSFFLRNYQFWRSSVTKGEAMAPFCVNFKMMHKQDLNFITTLECMFFKLYKTILLHILVTIVYSSVQWYF